MNTATVDLQTRVGKLTIQVNYTSPQDLVTQVMFYAAGWERRWAGNFDEPFQWTDGWEIEPIITHSTNDSDVDVAQGLLDS